MFSRSNVTERAKLHESGSQGGNERMHRLTRAISQASLIPLIKVALVCLALGTGPSIASAQIVSPREAAQIEVGPLSVYPTLRITDAGRDRNVFNDEKDAKEDLTFTI